MTDREKAWRLSDGSETWVQVDDLGTNADGERRTLFQWSINGGPGSVVSVTDPALTLAARYERDNELLMSVAGLTLERPKADPAAERRRQVALGYAVAVSAAAKHYPSSTNIVAWAAEFETYLKGAKQ